MKKHEAVTKIIELAAEACNKDPNSIGYVGIDFGGHPTQTAPRLTFGIGKEGNWAESGVPGSNLETLIPAIWAILEGLGVNLQALTITDLQASRLDSFDLYFTARVADVAVPGDEEKRTAFFIAEMRRLRKWCQFDDEETMRDALSDYLEQDIPDYRVKYLYEGRKYDE